MMKVFKYDFGALWVTFIDVETLICGYKQKIRQKWDYEPGIADLTKCLSIVRVCAHITHIIWTIFIYLTSRFFKGGWNSSK
jgi:hypothetical protein